MKRINKEVIHVSTEISNLESERNKLESDSPSCWGAMKNDEFVPSYLTVEQIPAGIYEIDWSSNVQSHIMKKQVMMTDELYQLPSPEITDILQDIETFWTSYNVYRKYNFVHKRGILMYGEPGCGKSGIIQLIIKRVIEQMDGIVINITNSDDLEYFLDFIPTLRKIEKERPIVVLMEDLDSIAGEDRYSTSRLLNILDGVKQIEGVVYLATTNYPEKLQERITNRPSRFDRRYKVDLPSSEIRKTYILNKLDSEDLKKIDIEDWVKRTDRMSLSHLKELIISVMVMGKTFDDSLSILEGFKESPKTKEIKKVGFSN